MVIKSKIGKLEWNITIKGERLSDEDISFIENFNPDIFHNDLECYFWAFDEELPSGRWLENMRFINALTSVNALVF